MQQKYIESRLAASLISLFIILMLLSLSCGGTQESYPASGLDGLRADYCDGPVLEVNQIGAGNMSFSVQPIIGSGDESRLAIVLNDECCTNELYLSVQTGVNYNIVSSRWMQNEVCSVNAGFRVTNSEMHLGIVGIHGKDMVFSKGPIAEVVVSDQTKSGSAGSALIALKYSRVHDLEVILEQSLNSTSSGTALDSILICWSPSVYGDTDGNGLVCATDLTPIGQYYNCQASMELGYSQVKSLTDFSQYSSVAAYADANHDNLITAADITTIGQNYNAFLKEWKIFYRDEYDQTKEIHATDYSTSPTITINHAGQSNSKYCMSKKLATSGLYGIDIESMNLTPQENRSIWLTADYRDRVTGANDRSDSFERDFSGYVFDNVTASGAIAFKPGELGVIGIGSSERVLMCEGSRIGVDNSRIISCQYDAGLTGVTTIHDLKTIYEPARVSKIDGYCTGDFGNDRNIAIIGRNGTVLKLIIGRLELTVDLTNTQFDETKWKVYSLDSADCDILTMHEGSCPDCIAVVPMRWNSSVPSPNGSVFRYKSLSDEYVGMKFSTGGVVDSIVECNIDSNGTPDVIWSTDGGESILLSLDGVLSSPYATRLPFNDTLLNCEDMFSPYTNMNNNDSDCSIVAVASINWSVNNVASLIYGNSKLPVFIYGELNSSSNDAWLRMDVYRELFTIDGSLLKSCIYDIEFANLDGSNGNEQDDIVYLMNSKFMEGSVEHDERVMGWRISNGNVELNNVYNSTVGTGQIEDIVNTKRKSTFGCINLLKECAPASMLIHQFNDSTIDSIIIADDCGSNARILVLRHE